MSEIISMYADGMSIETIAIVMDIDQVEVLEFLEEVYENQAAIA